MTPEQLSTLRALLARGLFFPAARELAETMLAVHERRVTGSIQSTSEVLMTDYTFNTAQCGNPYCLHPGKHERAPYDGTRCLWHCARCGQPMVPSRIADAVREHEARRDRLAEYWAIQRAGGRRTD